MTGTVAVPPAAAPRSASEQVSPRVPGSPPPARPSTWQRLDATGVPQVISRLALGGMFAWLAIHKLRQDPHTFAKFVKMYGLLPQDPPELINAVTVFMPWLELVCAVAVLAGVFMRGASLLSFLMLLAFTPAIYMHGIALFNEGRFGTLWEIEFDCGCGVGKQWWVGKIAANLGLMLAAWIVFKTRSRVLTVSGRLLGKPRITPTG